MEATWSQARTEVLARLAEVRRRIEAHDESGTLALVNQQDAFCDVAKKQREQQPPAAGQDLNHCHYCKGFLESGGCMGRLDEIDRAVLRGAWEEAREMLDEYAAWVRGLALRE